MTGCAIRNRSCLPFASTGVHPRFFDGALLLIISVTCVVYLFCSTLFCILCLMTGFSGLSIQDYALFSTVKFINQTSVWAWVTGSKLMYSDLSKIAFVRYHLHLLFHFFYVSKLHLLGLVYNVRVNLRSFSLLLSDLCFYAKYTKCLFLIQ